MKAATFCLLRMAFSQTGAHVMYKHHMNTALYQAFLRRLSVLKTPDMRGFRKESVRRNAALRAIPSARSPGTGPKYRPAQQVRRG